jgi:hypothetical protein
MAGWLVHNSRIIKNNSRIICEQWKRLYPSVQINNDNLSAKTEEYKENWILIFG